MNARPRVLLVGPWPPAQGGVATFMVNVANSPLRESYQIIPFTTARPAKHKLGSGDNHGYAAMFRGGWLRVLQGLAITALHMIKYPCVLVWHRPDVVQIQASDFTSFWEASLYVLVARLLGRATALRIGGSFNRFWEASGRAGRAGIAWTLDQPNVLIVQSEYWRSYVARIGRVGPVTVLNNFVPDALVRKRSAPSPAVPRFLLYAGETPQLKGLFVLLAAARDLHEKGIAVEITVVGVTPHFRSALEAGGLPPNIRLRGVLPHTEVLEQLRATDVFLQISYTEGFPNMLLEAMATGCASIVTPVGAVPEAVGEDGLCSFVIPVGESAVLADRMARFAAEPQLIARMAAASHDRLVERFTARSMTQVLDRLYRGLLPVQRGSSRAI